MSENDKYQPEEAPTERLLREALNARAQLVTAQSLRPMAPPSTRIRRLRPVVTVALPLFGLAAGVLGYFTLNTTPVAMHQEQPPAATVSAAPTVSPAASPSPSASSSASASASDNTSNSPTATPSSPSATGQQFNGVKFSLPAGWTLNPLSSSEACLMSPSAPQGFAGCSPYGVTLAVYTTPDELANETWPTTGDLSSPTGWSRQPYCSVWDAPHAIAQAESSTYKAIGSAQTTQVAVNGHSATKVQWQVACNANERFTAQLWGFLKEQVFVVSDGLKADYQNDLESIVGSLDLSGHADPLQAHANDVKVTFSGLTSGQQFPNDGTVLNFSVTWTNVSSTSYKSLAPVVATDLYSGGDPMLGMADGTLERQDGTSWTKLGSLSVGGGMDYATTGNAAAFSLAPGASHTINYRMSLTSNSGAGSLPLLANSFLPYNGKMAINVGKAQLPLQVVAKP